MTEVEEIKEEDIELRDKITENMYLEMANMYKHNVEAKNELIINMKKKLMILYSVFFLLDKDIDHPMIECGRSLASEMLDEVIFEIEND
jgi:hypothetical protein